jgi:ABC-2 type transport system ATP-binding protein
LEGIMTPDQLAIVTENVGRTFKKRGGRVETALDSINIEVKKGEIYGFLGPNGAGKTTLIKILVTLLFPSSGRAWVAGHDVVKDAKKVRPLINMVSGGESSGYGILTVRENIWLFSQFYGLSPKLANERIDFYLDKLELTADAGTKINRLSTGMRQKMNLVRGLVTDPKILFLDEPTIGLDVHIARSVRALLVDWVSERTDRTVFLTTHYMAEAEELCDRIAIIDRGNIVACDTPRGLRNLLGGESTYRLVLKPAPQDLSLFAAHSSVIEPYFGRRDEREGTREVRFSMNDESGLTDVLTTVKAEGHEVVRFAKEEPSLEDLFMKIVGRELESGE